MKKHSLAGFLLVLIGLAGCAPPPTAPTAPNIYIGGDTVIQTVGGQPGSGQASPCTATGGKLVSVIIGVVGGGGSENATEVKIGTSKFITCTPKCSANGVERDCSSAEVPAKPDFWGIVGGGSPAADFNAWPDNAYNSNLTGRAAGDVLVSCTVQGFSAARSFRVIS